MAHQQKPSFALRAQRTHLLLSVSCMQHIDSRAVREDLPETEGSNLNSWSYPRRSRLDTAIEI